MWLWKSQHYKLHLTVNLLWWGFFTSPDRWNSKKIPFSAKKQEKWLYHVQVLSSAPFILHCNDVMKGRVITHILCWSFPSCGRMKENRETSAGVLVWFSFFIQRAALAGLSYIKCKGDCSVFLVACDPSDRQICCRGILTFQQERRNNHVKWSTSERHL